MIATIADKNGSAIAATAAIDGFHMIVEWRPRGPGSNNIARAIPQIQNGGCESSTENSYSGLKSNFSPIAFQPLIFLYFSLYSFENLLQRGSYFCTSSIKSAKWIAFSMFVLAASMRKHPFLLAFRCLGRCERTGNGCNSATEIPYRWRKICFSYCLRMTDKRQKATKVKCKREESLTKQSIFWVSLELVGR